MNHSQNLSGATDVISTVLVANLPQIILIFLYFTYNGIFTFMLLNKEWSAYAIKRKFLRVTTSRGRQRSIYRLQLHYRYGVPLLIASSTLYWSVSQLIFLARIKVFDSLGVEITDAGISTCGYSPMVLISVIILRSIIVLVGIANDFRELSHKMPLADSCSAAISAACHPPKADVNASLKRVVWSVIAEGSDNSDSSIDHCSFTSFEVKTPIVGKRYAELQRQ